MFTQQTPFLLSTLQNNMDPMASMQMAQAFGNCNQPLTHRAGVSLNAPASGQTGGVLSGTGGNNYSYADGQFGYLAGNDISSQISPWATGNRNYYGGDQFVNNVNFSFRPGSQFYSLYPDAATNAFYNLSQSFNFGPISTTNNSNWTTRLGDVNTFDMSTRLGDVVNNYAGPTFQVAGDSYYDNSFHNNSTFNNQYVTNQNVDNSTVNNITVTGDVRKVTGDPGKAGPAGPPGNPGLPGERGADGAIVLIGGGGYSLPAITLVSGNNPAPRGIVTWPAGQANISVPGYKLAGKGSANVIQDYAIEGTASVDVPTYTGSVEGLSATVAKYALPSSLTVVFPSITFDADTCSIVIDPETPGQTVTLEVTSTELASDGTEDVDISGTVSLTEGKAKTVDCDVSMLTVAPQEAVPVEVSLADASVQPDPADAMAVPLPIPVFNGVAMPVVRLGPGGSDLVPKPFYP